MTYREMFKAGVTYLDLFFNEVNWKLYVDRKGEDAMIGTQS